MIKKFIKISGTGKFLDYSHSIVPSPFRTTDFEKVNLIYGENGCGKTTLSIVLNSLKSDNALLSKKRSFDRSIPQKVEILTDHPSSPRFTFDNNSWNNHYPNIEIFDIHFINNNIYTGLEIQNSHKKNLFEIIFGSQGVQLKNDIQLIKDRIQAGRTTINNVSSQIEIAINRAFSVSDYCNLSADPDIDNKISVKEAELLTARSFQQIQAKNILSDLPLVVLPFDVPDAINTINQSIDSISAEYLDKFHEHTEHLEMDGKEEEWIKQGYEAIQENTCPFCRRPFDETTDIIEAYNQYFNEEYNELLQKISTLVSTTTTFNIEAQLLSIENVISSNLNLIDFWKTHLQNQPQLTSISDKIEAIKISYEAIKALITSKSQNPIQPQPTTDLSAFRSLIEGLNSELDDFNTNISDYNTRIATLKTNSPQNVLQLEAELKRLKAIKKKEDANISQLCTNLSTYTTAVENLISQKDTKQTQLDTYSSTIFSNYATKINQYLQIFAPYLEIRDFVSGYVGRSTEPMVKYALHINGNEIKSEDNPTHPSFKYSLSEGDKSALALSFFLTKLELDGNIQDKIIVFDDPVSSFDFNRKSATISKLIEFAQIAEQLFVLTHNLIFASEFWKGANQISCTTQCSKIEFVNNTSCIVEYNIDTETLSSVLKDSLRIKDYLNNGCFTDQERRSVARCLRPALESYFHLKFFDLVAQNDWLGDFISKIRNATTTDPYHRLQSNLSELTAINAYSKKYHHRFNTNNESEPVTDAELRNFSQQTLDLIQVI